METTEKNIRQNGKPSEGIPNPEVVAQAQRRRFNAEYKLRIVQEADACTERGEIGALLRREGLYSSQLTTWRRQRDAGQLKTLGDNKRGRKGDSSAKEMARLKRENERLRRELEKAQLIMDAQKKLSQVLGLTLLDSQEKSEEQ